jgi:hypothetical protein
MRHYQLILAIFWFAFGMFLLLRNGILSEDLRERWNLQYAWLFITVAFALTLWNVLRWYANQQRKRMIDPSDWNPLKRRKTDAPDNANRNHG